MKRPTLNPKAVFLIVLVLAAVVNDTFTTGSRILPLPLLSFLQGFIFVAAPASIWWMIASKIQVSRDRKFIGMEMSYSGAENFQVNENIQ